MKECKECDGVGKIEYDKMGICNLPHNECCGGCTYELECIECDGQGYISDDCSENGTQDEPLNSIAK